MVLSFVIWLAVNLIINAPSKEQREADLAAAKAMMANLLRAEADAIENTH